MNNQPIKIIWKYKNNNKRIQYNVNIFVGSVPKEINKVLDIIKEYTLYETFAKLSKQDYNILEKYYGNFWYRFFFNTYHINNIIQNIRDNRIQKKELTDKYGKEWISTHIDDGIIREKKILYSYESIIKTEVDRKTQKKDRQIEGIEDETDLDYKTNIKKELENIFYKTLQRTKNTKSQNIMKGGAGVIDNDIEMDKIDDDLDLDENPFNTGEEQDELMGDDEEMDLAEIEQLYKEVDVDPDKNLDKTTELIKKAIEDDKIFDKKNTLMLQFDDSEDNSIHDTNLKDVYIKNYVKSQFIFKDDTIKIIKNKIICSLKNNDKFEKNSKLIPSRIYLWSEYLYNNKLEKIMIGQKWLRRNELLNIDVEPNNNTRIYEELGGNLKTLRDNIKRYGNRIRREDDENKLIYDYDNFYTNNEFYMIDLYNEFGKKYGKDNDIIKADSEIQKNLLDIYLKLYFPKIKQDEFRHIIEYLNGEIKVESNKNNLIFDTIYNDLVMENEIVQIVEDIKLEPGSKYKKIFKENFVTQSVIHVNLKMKNQKEKDDKFKLDLFRIFNEFVPNDKYPFIQYQTSEGQIIFKYKEDNINQYIKDKENSELLSKWFENAPYGISFKVKINEKGIEKFMAINLNDQGRIEYKTQWKEEDNATIDDIKFTYAYVKDLITILNKDNNKFDSLIPEDDEFRYAFINTIQKFELPENFVISHNDLSEFSRYFHPYVSLVIEPRKRLSKESKVEEKSKFGTYLRFKRVTGYENSARIEQRIIYFMRNYEFTDIQLINEISKQFNITEERTIEEIEKVRSRYPNIRKSRKSLKKLENIPKYKPPGIGIDIQGKQRENYKIRISGARDKEQLDRILAFMNILLYLYIETYLFKKSERQELKEKLKKLSNIAKRRGKVDDIVNYAKDNIVVKQITSMDKLRLGFKPTEDQNQWTRCCQNSGKDKRRRPQQYSSINMSELIKKGYSFNKKTQEWERKIITKNKKTGKKEEIILKTIKLPEMDQDENPTGNEIHYACGPDENGEHMYVGFLSRCINPHGHCMPCCFKKDLTSTNNNKKMDFFKKCMGDQSKDDTKSELTKTQEQQNMLDKLYILQDTNKIQNGRMGFLPKYLDFFLNIMLEKDKIIKQHYLSISKKGYMFKYGVDQDNQQFLSALSVLLDLSIIEIKEKIIKSLNEDKLGLIFNSLNNGDIKLQFQTKENYIDYIKYNNLDFDLINNIVSIPGIITSGGLNIVVFYKQTTIIKKTLEKEKFKEDFYILCQNQEDKFSITDINKDTIFMLKENKNYFPIIMAFKHDEYSKNFDLIKKFRYHEKQEDNIVKHILDFYKRNCHATFLDDMLYKNLSLSAVETLHILEELNDKNLMPRYQVIDVRNKCKFFITNNNYLIPVRVSGSIYNIQIIKSYDKYFHNFKETYEFLKKINQITNEQLKTKPIGIYYDTKDKNKLNVIAIFTIGNDIIPINPEKIDLETIEKYNLIIQNKPLFDNIDKEIIKGKDNLLLDDRIEKVNYDKFFNESYELFRLELSNYLHKNSEIRNKIINIIDAKDNKLTDKDKLNKIKLLLYRLIDKDLYKKYKISINLEDDIELSEEYNEVYNLEENSEDNQTGGAIKKIIHVINKLPDISKYKVSNEREVCEVNVNKEKCNINPHCYYYQNNCYLGITKKMVIIFINKVSQELIEYDLKAFEILRIGDYFVSDIVDYNTYKEHPGQKIVKSSSSTIKKVLQELFGKDNTPKIGRRKNIKNFEIDYQQLNEENPPRYLGDHIIQDIIPNNITLFRSYVNCYYWLKNNFYDDQTRNLGYYHPVQTDFANYFKSLIIDWLQEPSNLKEIEDNLYKYMEIKKKSKDYINDFIVKLGNDMTILTNCITELYILNKIEQIPILVYDDDDILIYVFNNGIKYNYYENKTKSKEIEKLLENKSKFITLKFTFISNKSIPDDIESIYYK